MTLAAGIALVTVRAGIAASCRTNWPLGIYVGVIAAGFVLAARGRVAVRRRASAPRAAVALGPVPS
jgi:hypothetical protein